VFLSCAAVAACVCLPVSAAISRAPVSVAFSVGYTTPAALRAALAGEDVAVTRRVRALRIVRVRARPGLREHLRARPGIRFVERVRARSTAVEPALQLSARAVPFEWQFAAAHEDAVPDWVLRAASAVTIAVVDTGADLTAPDLAAKTPLAYNTRTGTGDVRDFMGHGTFVAAIAAGSVTNGEGIAGFGGDAKLMVVKTGPGDGTFTDFDEAAAITYAVDHGARIVNLSIGGETTSVTEQTAIDYAASRNVLLVAAAGNEYTSGNPTEYPAALLQPAGSNGVGGKGLAVGASTPAGTRAAFSNTGSYLSLAAPGDGVFSALSGASAAARFPRVQLPGSLKGLYGYASGTSFAAPQVAGAAALVWAANPLLDAKTVAQVLKASASQHGAWTPELGFGVLDAAAAVALAAGTPAPAVVASQAVLRLGADVSRRSVTFSARLGSLTPSVSPAGRTVELDRYDDATGAWATVRTARTAAGGQAAWRLPVTQPGTARYRARWDGAGDLAAVVSRTVIVSAR
jgi:subtilisin family serine protease